MPHELADVVDAVLDHGGPGGEEEGGTEKGKSQRGQGWAVARKEEVGVLRFWGNLGHPVLALNTLRDHWDQGIGVS